ncbi:uncharacterized protein [Gossypium hirsutum]|uniref:Uncharacterized protein n=1 Tax=Gossypium hirsutum TaxID=3635 RepID=A0ABM3BNH4_GOSHI|nr:uncharacterized protein LOC121229174 [Gossypium hirsutum]
MVLNVFAYVKFSSVFSYNKVVLSTYDQGQSCSFIFWDDRLSFGSAVNCTLALDLVVHDFVLMPFLDRYVKTVPLAAEILDVRRNQKLEMVKQLQVEKARFRFEVEIGKSPPLSDEELWWELRRKAPTDSINCVFSQSSCRIHSLNQFGGFCISTSYSIELDSPVVNMSTCWST